MLFRSRPATVGIGISLDEVARANNRRSEPYEDVTYPLLDLRVRRDQCPAIIRSAGLPVPPKSACWFCPLKRLGAWADMRRDRPGLFGQACALEAGLNDRRAVLGRDEVYLTSRARPLASAIPAGGQALLTADTDDADADCGGRCFT